SLTSTLCISIASAVLVGCAASSPQKAPAAAALPKGGDATALTLTAETDLKRGDCRSASENYARAAALGNAQLARRATQVAMACEHLPAASQASSRWRTLSPADPEANALYAAVALKQYRTADGRAAIRDFWHAEQLQSSAAASPSTPPAAGAANKPPAPRTTDRAAASLTELTALLLEESDPSAVLSAMSGALEPTANSAATFTLLGELALAGYDGQRAERYAKQALQYDPKDTGALKVLARAYVMRGDAAQAIATAREVAALDPTRGGFELAEILAALDRTEEAHEELERLRGHGASQVEVDRRLALLAYDSGDMQEAKQRFQELVANGEGNDAAQLYLADIAARQGDVDTALSGYRRLYDSSVALSARSRAAALLLDRRSRTEALALLDDYAADHPEEELDLTLAKARLLADHGEPDTSLALLGAELERHPQHPSIEYDRAVTLEQAGQVHESVEAFEQMLAGRPEDPTLMNALGYTLADHTLELPHAEGLIKRALTVTPDNPAALDSLGWVHYRQGDAKGAAGTLQRAYSLGHDPEIAAHWGETLWVSGDQNDARKVWAAALAREPDSKQLKATVKRFVPDAH
ncbi:MAG TPA: tetratricopeptide repeat protein, partial [Steroidobacteraceae bacterium]|nr:tetratricopeptide repeat protein [Steroidobacteraceae bacterium]